MRDKIAQIISDDVDAHLNSGIPWDGTKAADAIIAALSTRIQELEAKLVKAAGWLDLIANHQAANPHEDTECQAYARGALAEIKGETP